MRRITVVFIPFKLYYFALYSDFLNNLFYNHKTETVKINVELRIVHLTVE